MAKHLARIHGTEEDKVNCPFYFKIGACRHADRCSRLHHRPAFSPTILIKHIYRHPIREVELKAMAEGHTIKNPKSIQIDEDKALEDFLQFFENMYHELAKFGRIESLHVCDNLGDHIIGHVYVKFYDEEQASDALNILNGRYYDGRKMEVEFSPVTDFREARCRDFDEGSCIRGGFCNFMHIKPVPVCWIKALEEESEMERRREEKERLERKEREHRGRGDGHGSSSSGRRKKRRHREGGSSSSRRERSSSSRKRHRRSADSDGERENHNHDGDSDDSRRGRTSSRRSERKARSYSRSRSRSRSRSNSPAGDKKSSSGSNSVNTSSEDNKKGKE